MSADPTYILLKWSAWIPATHESNILGAVVKDYHKPINNSTPENPLDHNHYPLITRKFHDLVINGHSNDNHSVEARLSILAGIKFAGHTDNNTNLTGKVFHLKRLQQENEFWDELKTDDSVKSRVPEWVSRFKTTPVCVIVGILIAEDVEVCTKEKQVAEREANGDAPIGAISMASGIPLPFGDAADIKARVKSEKDDGAVFMAKSRESNIIALDVRPVKSKLWNKQKLVIKDEVPKDAGQQLGRDDEGDEGEEDEEERVDMDDLVLGSFAEGD